MSLYTEDELKPKTLAALKKLGDQHELEQGEDYTNKAELIKALLKINDPDDELEPEDELEDELEEDLDDEAELDAEEDEEDIDLDEELDDEEDEKAIIHRKKQQLDKEIDESIANEMANAKAGRKATPKPAPAAKKTPAKKQSTEGGEDVLAAKQVATILGVEAKTLRQFLRSSASTFEAVGSGGRYEFTEDQVPKLKEEFDAWKSGHGSRGTKRGTGTTKGKASKPAADTLEEVEEIEELEPDFEELDEEELELDDEELDEEL